MQKHWTAEWLAGWLGYARFIIYELIDLQQHRGFLSFVHSFIFSSSSLLYSIAVNDICMRSGYHSLGSIKHTPSPPRCKGNAHHSPPITHSKNFLPLAAASTHTSNLWISSARSCPLAPAAGLSPWTRNHRWAWEVLGVWPSKPQSSSR